MEKSTNFVWTVSDYYPYEGGQVFGVFSSKKGAIEFIFSQDPCSKKEWESLGQDNYPVSSKALEKEAYHAGYYLLLEKWRVE